MPADRTQPTDVLAPVEVARPKPVPKTAEEKAAIQLERDQEFLRKRKLVESSLPILASKDSTQEEKLQAAEDFKLGVHGNRGMDELVQGYGEVLGPLLRNCKLQARHDYKCFLRYPRLVFEALKMYGLAGKALVDLNRPKKHGDGRRAFILLKTFLFITLDAIILFRKSGQEQWNHIYGGTGMYNLKSTLSQYQEIQAVKAAYTPTPEETAKIETEKEDLFHLLYLTCDELLRAAVCKYKAELGPKRTYELCEEGSDWYEDLGHRCFRLNDECGYDIKKKVRDRYATDNEVKEESPGSAGFYDSGYHGDSGLGQRIFWKSRDEMSGWYYDYKDWLREEDGDASE